MQTILRSVVYRNLYFFTISILNAIAKHRTLLIVMLQFVTFKIIIKEEKQIFNNII